MWQDELWDACGAVASRRNRWRKRKGPNTSAETLGIARTHEIDIVAYTSTPTVEQMAAQAGHVQAQPWLAPTPEALAAAKALG
jgi:hypothetical protein